MFTYSYEHKLCDCIVVLLTFSLLVRKSLATNKLPVLILQCLRPPYGVLYLATKRNYVGFNSAARQLRSLVDEEGIFGAHLVKETADREIWKFFLK